MTRRSNTRETRRSILEELRAMEDLGLAPPSTVELAKRMGMPRSSLQYHVGWLRDYGLVTTSVGRSATVSLTEPGRIAAGS